MVEVTKATDTHAVGEIGTVVGRSDSSVLVEFADADGRTLALDDLPRHALRLATNRTAA